ncbi:MAG: hypothetical protein ABIK61_06430 [candidate division WOR-3 bacterium]
MLVEEITPSRRDEILHKIALKVVEMKLTPMAIVLLESSKPLSFVGSQLMVFFQPIYSAVFPARPYNEIATLLENRENIELLIKEIEKLENESRNIKKPNPSVKENHNHQDSEMPTSRMRKISIFSQIVHWFKK